MQAAGVVHHEVEDQADASPMAFVDEPVEIGQRAEDGIDGGVVHHVVPAIEHGRRVDRGQPDGVHAERLRAAGEMVQVVDQPLEVADPVTARVGEAPWVDLVDDAFEPPRAGGVQVGGGC